MQHDGVTRGEVPLAEPVSIAVRAAVALALEMTVEGDVEVIVAPRMIPRGKGITHMFHTLIHRRSGDNVLLRCIVQRLRLSFGIGEGVASAEREASRKQEFS